MRLGLAILLAILPGLTGIAAAQVPSYISSMSDYQIRNLTGTFTPTNGTSTITSVTPSEWQTSDPGSLIGVIQAWSGGAKAMTGTKLYVHGGGHHDSGNNGLYTFDLSGTTAPVGWSVVISPVSAIRANTATYSDGKPLSVHTYDGMFAATNGFLYRFGGAEHDNGFFVVFAYKFNTATNTWTQLASLPSRSEFTWPVTLYDPTSQKAIVASANSFEYRVFRLADDSWSSVKTFGFLSGSTAGDYHTGCFDTSRNRGVWFGEGTNQLVKFNASAERATIASQSISGLPAMSGPSCVYDAAMDRYWVLGGPTSSSGWTTIYEINAGTFAATPHILTGNTISRMSGMIGSFGRVAFLPTYRAIAIIADVTTPVSVIKLPAAGGPADRNDDTRDR